MLHYLFDNFRIYESSLECRAYFFYARRYNDEIKLNDENKPALISTVVITLAIFALILLCVYVSTFVVAPCPQELRGTSY